MLTGSQLAGDGAFSTITLSSRNAEGAELEWSRLRDWKCTPVHGRVWEVEHLGAKRSEAPLWVGRPFRAMVRQRHQLWNVSDSSQRSPRRGEPRFARAPPRTVFVRWRIIKIRKASFNKQIGRTAQSIRGSWRQPTSSMEPVWCFFKCAEQCLYCSKFAVPFWLSLWCKQNKSSSEEKSNQQLIHKVFTSPRFDKSYVAGFST